MAKKILSGATVKVENMSGFDKSRLNLLTTHVGTLTPIVKQLMLPGNFKLSLDIHSKLPPLAFDAYLRSHLKVEAFFVPMRLCYGGFESWFCGKELYSASADSFIRAKLPRLFYSAYAESEVATTLLPEDGAEVPVHGGAGSLLDYFGARFALTSGGFAKIGDENAFQRGPIETEDGSSKFAGVENADLGMYFSIFPHVSYALIYDEWYRNKLVQRPLFAPIDPMDNTARENFKVAHLPYSGFTDIKTVMDHYDYFYGFESGGGSNFSESVLSDMLLDHKSIFELRQRNYGDDYFTCASPSAQEGSPSSVSTAGGSFTISSLRAQNAMQEFKELNNLASPDYRQTMSARYGVSPSAGVAQKPILLGSADYPYFTQGQALASANGAVGAGYNNPFVDDGLLGAKGGVATANGTQFICSGKIDEPGYLMVLASFVPEANYASGIAHDLELFTQEGSLVDLPVGILEHVGNEPILTRELNPSAQADIFGFVQRYLWHKAGSASNEVHGLFRKGMSLAAAVPQRDFFDPHGLMGISSNFLRIRPDDLDGITAVSSALSNYGIMLDCSVDLKVSEPLSESALPSLSNPASEHGRSVYLKHGGSKIA